MTNPILTPLKFRVLYCDKEKTWTKHVLSPDGRFYTCGCGETIDRFDAQDGNDAADSNHAER